MKRYFVYTGLIAFVLLSCKKVQPEMNPQYEGCDCATEVSADFVMEEKTTNAGWARFTNTDSIFGNKNVRFYALENDAEYKWYIGSEIVDSRELTRYFDNSLVGQSFNVSLVVKKKPNAICFPNDTGYDSVVKTLSVAKPNTYTFLDTSLMEGVYRMKSPFLPDSVEIKIDYRNYGNDKRIDIYNFDGVGSNCLDRIYRSEINYRQFWTFGSSSVTQCDYLQGDVHYRLDGIVEMNFTTGGFVSGQYITELNEFKFRGRKL